MAVYCIACALTLAGMLRGRIINIHVTNLYQHQQQAMFQDLVSM